VVEVQLGEAAQAGNAVEITALALNFVVPMVGLLRLRHNPLEALLSVHSCHAIGMFLCLCEATRSSYKGLCVNTFDSEDKTMIN
jgi:hypothetical protein